MILPLKCKCLFKVFKGFWMEEKCAFAPGYNFCRWPFVVVFLGWLALRSCILETAERISGLGFKVVGLNEVLTQSYSTVLRPPVRNRKSAHTLTSVELKHVHFNEIKVRSTLSWGLMYRNVMYITGVIYILKVLLVSWFGSRERIRKMKYLM